MSLSPFLVCSLQLGDWRSRPSSSSPRLPASWPLGCQVPASTWTAGCAEATSPVPSADSVSTTVGRSKTSNVPVVVSVAARPDSRCPVRALLDYLAFFPLLRLPQDGGCPLCLPRLRNDRPIIIIKPMTEADFIASRVCSSAWRC